MDAETLRMVIRKSVVQNQDEQLATVLLEMISAISGLEQQAAAQEVAPRIEVDTQGPPAVSPAAMEYVLNQEEAARPSAGVASWCEGPPRVPAIAVRYCQHGSQYSHMITPAESLETSPLPTMERATTASPSDAAKCQCPPWIVAPGAHVASCPMAATTPKTSPSSRSGLKGIKSGLVEPGSDCAHPVTTYHLLKDGREIVGCEVCRALWWYDKTHVQAAAPTS